MIFLCLLLLLVLNRFSDSSYADSGVVLVPQDDWYPSGFVIRGNFGAVAVGRDENIYVVTNGAAVAVFSANGTLLRKFGENLAISAIAVDSETNVYVLDRTAVNRIKKFNALGELLFEFGTAGNGETNINPVAGYASISIDSQDRVYVADSGNHRVQVFDKNGGHVRHWGENDIFHFGDTFVGLVALPNNNICIKDQNVLLIYSPEGLQLVIKGLDGAGRPPSLAVSPDGLIWTGRYSGNGNDGFQIYDVRAGDISGNLAVTGGPRGLRFSLTDVRAAAFDDRSTLYITSGTTNGGALFSMNRNYRRIEFPTDAPIYPSTIPVPHILSILQRPGTSLVDIDYRVRGGNSNRVTTGIVGFRAGSEGLGSVIKMTDFAGQTHTNIGAGIPVEAVHRLTWDASEAATNFLNLEFEILARDNRELLPNRFITLPEESGDPSLTISSQPVQDTDCLSLWLWFIATGDSGIILTNGEIKGVGGGYDGQTLALGTTTTAHGRTWLYSRMSVRAPTAAEVTRAQSGSYGLTAFTANSVVKLSQP